MDRAFKNDSMFELFALNSNEPRIKVKKKTKIFSLTRDKNDRVDCGGDRGHVIRVKSGYFLVRRLQNFESLLPFKVAQTPMVSNKDGVTYDTHSH
jgi:hypothetical protein